MDELTRLLLLGRDGDRVALAAWIRRSQAEVWRLCASLVDRRSADDLTQEVFLRAHAAMGSYRGEASARTWLLAITRNVCADTVRRRQRRRRLRSLVAESEPASLGSEIEAADLLLRLEADRREAFVLTQLLGLTYHEAAEVCGCPIGTIRSRVARARADLIAALEEDDSAAGAPA